MLDFKSDRRFRQIFVAFLDNMSFNGAGWLVKTSMGRVTHTKQACSHLILKSSAGPTASGSGLSRPQCADSDEARAQDSSCSK